MHVKIYDRAQLKIDPLPTRRNQNQDLEEMRNCFAGLGVGSAAVVAAAGCMDEKLEEV